jgi:hypothetical protein
MCNFAACRWAGVTYTVLGTKLEGRTRPTLRLDLISTAISEESYKLMPSIRSVISLKDSHRFPLWCSALPVPKKVKRTGDNTKTFRVPPLE